MLVRNGMTNIGKVICRLFDFLAVIMNSEQALFERLELFFEMDGTVILIVGEQRSQRLLQVMGRCCFRENNTRQIIRYCVVNPGL